MRLSAMVVHIVGTLLIACMSYLLIREIWYPDFFWAIAGGSGLFLLICAVDAVLGPLLTLAVFNPSKGIRKLRADLLVIVFLQLAALCYGIFVVASVRPLFLVYTVDRFNLVTASELTAAQLRTAELPAYRELRWLGPQIIGTREPRSGDEKFEFIDSALSGRDRQLLPKTYVPLSQVKDALISHIRPLDSLSKLAPTHATLISHVKTEFASRKAKLGFIPVIAQGDWIMIVDGDTGELLRALPIDGM